MPVEDDAIRDRQKSAMLVLFRYGVAERKRMRTLHMFEIDGVVLSVYDTCASLASP